MKSRRNCVPGRPESQWLKGSGLTASAEITGFNVERSINDRYRERCVCSD